MGAHMDLTPPSREQAQRWLADAGIFHHLEVMEVTPGGKPTPKWLGSLLDLVEFLMPLDAEGRLSRAVNFADPAKVVGWVRDGVGDPELADRMDAVVAGGLGYALLAPRLRELALARVVQCWELLKEPEQPAS